MASNDGYEKMGVVPSRRKDVADQLHNYSIFGRALLL